MPKIKFCIIPTGDVCYEHTSEKYNRDFIVITKIKLTYLNKQEHVSFDGDIKVVRNKFTIHNCFINHLIHCGKYTHNENKIKLYPKVYTKYDKENDLIGVCMYRCTNYSKIWITLKITNKPPKYMYTNILQDYHSLCAIFNTKFVIMSGTDINEMNKICVDGHRVRVCEDQCDKIDTMYICVISSNGEQLKLSNVKDLIRTSECSERQIEVIVPEMIGCIIIVIS